MRKSSIIRLLLIISLVISLAIPFASMNIISNNKAMAQGYNSYNEYPTKDYKYECRTGPFEGFFVSSVEFCLVDNQKKDRPIAEPPVPPTTPPAPPDTCAENVETCFRTALGANSEDFTDLVEPLQEGVIITIGSGESFTFESFEDFCVPTCRSRFYRRTKCD